MDGFLGIATSHALLRIVAERDRVSPMTKVRVAGVDANLNRLAVLAVENAVKRIGFSGWCHISASHREGLVAAEGLSLILTQDESHMTPEKYRALTQLFARVASAAGLDDNIGCDKIDVTVEV